MIDAEGRTDKNRRNFKYREQFDTVYGTKARTRPKAVCDNRNVATQGMGDDSGKGGFDCLVRQAQSIFMMISGLFNSVFSFLILYCGDMVRYG